MTTPLLCRLGRHAKPFVAAAKDQLFRSYIRGKKLYVDIQGVAVTYECPRCHKQTVRYGNQIGNEEYYALIANRIKEGIIKPTPVPTQYQVPQRLYE